MKKVYLETFGCQMNVSDSERVATRLAAEGFEMTANEAAADVVLFNTCSVREKAEHKLYTRVGQVRNPDGTKPVVGVMGCVAQLEGETLFAKSPGVDFVIGTQAVGRVARAIENVFDQREGFYDLGVREENYDWTTAPAQRHSPFVAFVPIIEGCNKFCTYCIVPFSRGREKSLPAAQIVGQVSDLRAQGVKEIHLIGQNVNSYRPKSDVGLENFRGATPFSKLLRAVAATGIERIKFTTSFPRDFHSDIVDAINENENLCNWVHLPFQSGSNRVLKSMRRGHTIESYLSKIDKIKSSPRKIALSTDIIVGFPTETEEEFLDTLKTAQRCEFDSAYIFKYSPRPGTPAAEMADDVAAQEKTERFLRLEKVLRQSQTKSLQSCVDKVYEVLAEKKSFNKKVIKEIDGQNSDCENDNFQTAKTDGNFSGHTTCHKVVNFESSNEMLGQIVQVKITKSKTNTLYGEVC
jgi:tRNA-2-methylthio-N6-dimethylallyladenosine synthase